MRVVIRVESEHLAAHDPAPAGFSAIELAAMAAIPHNTYAVVDGRYLAVSFVMQSKLPPMRALLPVSAGRALEDLDLGRPVEPFSFLLQFEPADPTA